MPKYAFIGTRVYPQASYKYIDSKLSSLTKGDIVVSGGASGVDSYAIQQASKNGLETVVYTARPDGDFNAFDAFHRNNLIINDADFVFAFWDTKSNGTLGAINAALLANKPVTIITPRGLEFSPSKDVIGIVRGSVCYAEGDILSSNADAIVNPCNTHGACGAGLSRQLAEKWPWWVSDYKSMCASGRVQTGKVQMSRSVIDGLPHIIHLPTKDDWRKPSKMTFIKDGLDSLVQLCEHEQLVSVAIPKLGCGLGGLQWPLVNMRIRASLSDIRTTKFVVYI